MELISYQKRLSLAKKVTCLLVLFIVSSCEDMGEYNYIPQEGLNFQFDLEKMEHMKEHDAIFVYFDLEIENRSREELSFNPGDIRAALNGKMNDFTYYDSLGSVLTERKKLPVGKTSYRLYFVFPENAGEELVSFDVVDFGLGK